jgi:hypothetical protein
VNRRASLTKREPYAAEQGYGDLLAILFLVHKPSDTSAHTVQKWIMYEGVSKSFPSGRLGQELQMVQSVPLSAVVSLFCESF